MREHIRERWIGWGTRLSFAALLLVFSEWVVWQQPTEFNLLEWAAIAAVYLALSAIALDLIALLHVNDVFSLLILAGLYGLVNATLISHITTRDLPISLVIRPLAAQPLAFMLALAAFLMLSSGRRMRPLDAGVALAAGLAWGIWVRWFPVVSEENVPEVDLIPALLAVAIGLLVCGAIRWALPPADLYRRDDWRLMRIERALMVAILWAALVIGYAQDQITGTGLLLIAVLGGMMIVMLIGTVRLRRQVSWLDAITPPRRPNLAAWVLLVAAFLVAGAISYSLPGDGDSSIQSKLLFGALTGFGLVWPPAVSALIGMRAFVQMAREGM